MEALHEELPFDLDFHPSSPLVVTSLITGELCLYDLRTTHTLNPIPFQVSRSGLLVLTATE